MKEEIRQKELGLPVGYHRTTGKIVTLSEVGTSFNQLRPVSELSLKERIAFMLQRWEAGGWEDIVYAGEGIITLPRARQELESESEIGLFLLNLYERALEFLREDFFRTNV